MNADAQTRTADLLITNQLLYHLSYTGKNGTITDIPVDTFACLDTPARTFDAALARIDPCSGVRPTMPGLP